MRTVIKKVSAPFKANSILLLLLLGGTERASMVMAQSTGIFTATGDMVTTRANHTATLLPNGKVLIAGGIGSSAFNPPLATAELYDPSSGTFARTSDMIKARSGHTATLLADGRVLISGGARDLSAELYDPSTGKFSATGDMITRPLAFNFAQGTLLRDGRVLLAGDATAQIYDPTNGTFARNAGYAGTNPSYLDTATLLSDGRVLITGGTKVAGWTELYDPASGTFSLTGPMRGWENVNRATLLTNGEILLVGNAENDGFPADAELYDDTTRTFHVIGKTAVGHEFSTAVLLPDGTVFIAGGQLPGGDGEAASELYTPATGRFAIAGNMITARHGHSATLLPDGAVLIAGGFSAWPSPTSRAELYKPPVLQAGPALLSLSGDGRGQGAILHAGTSLVASACNPAASGEALEIYSTGLIDRSVIPPQVTIGGRVAEILFFGTAPGYKSLNQVNVRVPSGVAPGAAVPVRLTYLSRSSNEVTIGLK